MLHSVGISAAAEDLESLRSEQLVLVDAVILVPDPIRVAIAVPVRDGVAERLLVDEAIAHEIVGSDDAAVIDAAIGNSDIVPLVEQTKREPEPGEVLCGDNEAHCSQR